MNRISPGLGWVKTAAFVLLLLPAVTLLLPAQKPGAAEQRYILQRLEQTIVEEVKFQNATLEDLVSFLKEQLRGGERTINFVITPGATEFAQGRSASLELRQVPARVVLEYTARLLEVEVKIEPHAILFTAPARLPAPAPASRPTP